MPEGCDPEITKLRGAGGQGLAPREHQQILSLHQLLPHLARQFPKDAFRPIASHGHAEAFADDDSDAGVRGPRGEGDQVEERSLKPAAVLFDPFDLGSAPQEEVTISRRSRHPPDIPQTVSLARPLALRRAKTFRPCFVLIRFRKPWSLFLFKFEGCLNVKDIVKPLPHSSFHESRSLYGRFHGVSIARATG